MHALRSPRPFGPPLCLALVLAITALGCEPDAPSAPTTAAAHAALTPSQGPARSAAPLVRSLDAFPDELVLPWGFGDGQVGMVPADTDRLAFPPLAAAIGVNGEVLILDQVNDRVITLTSDGRWLRALPAPLAPTDITVDAAGHALVLSLVNRRLSLLTERGVAEEIEVPEALPIGGVATTPEGDVIVTNRQQETFRLGRPGQWIAWPDLLKTKREGHGQETGGHPVQTLVRDGHAWLLTQTPGLREPRTVRLSDTAGVASAVALASYPNGDVLTVLERWQGEGVVRALVRYDSNGEKLGETPVHGLPIAFPFRELVPSDDGAALQLLPLADGLHLRVLRVQGGAS